MSDTPTTSEDKAVERVPFAVTLLREINRDLHVNGTTVRALDVLDNVTKETLVKTLTHIVTRLTTDETKPQK